MKNRNPVVHKLLESFVQFHKLNWKQSPMVSLKSSEIMVLFSIKKLMNPDTPGIKMSDISNALRVASPTITQLINSLETNGFVERTMDKEDRRAVRVKLTDKGEGAIEKASESFYEAFNGLAEFLGEENSNLLADLLSQTFTYFEKRKKEIF